MRFCLVGTFLRGGGFQKNVHMTFLLDSDVARFSDQGGAEKILGGRIAATQTRSKLNGKTKQVQTGGSISFVYRLSQNETKHKFEMSNLYCYK